MLVFFFLSLCEGEYVLSLVGHAAFLDQTSSIRNKAFARTAFSCYGKQMHAPNFWFSPAFLFLIQFYIPGKAAAFTASQQVLIWAGGD